MQHLDEGTIHAWLDGALSPDEAARVEAHAKECPECAAAIAEARGFIAASSRILTALDHVPRGVVPAAVQKKRFDPFVWRIAATLLVVAAGTLVVVRTRGGDSRLQATAADSALLNQASSTSVATPALAGAGSSATTSAPKAAKVSPRASRSDAAAKTAPQREPTSSGNSTAGTATSMMAPATPSRAADAAAMDRAAEPEPLHVIATPQRIGASVTVYEVGADTVTLTESKPLALVAAGAGAARQTAGKAVAEPRRMAPAAAAPESRAQSLPAAPPPAAVFSGKPLGSSQAANVITWSDPSTGSAFTLTGRISPARLEQLKLRIEREKAAAAAAAKRNP
jgi:anti-sigma factor RsiW